jgi:hypothetical protein
MLRNRSHFVVHRLILAVLWLALMFLTTEIQWSNLATEIGSKKLSISAGPPASVISGSVWLQAIAYNGPFQIIPSSLTSQ